MTEFLFFRGTNRLRLIRSHRMRLERRDVTFTVGALSPVAIIIRRATPKRRTLQQTSPITRSVRTCYWFARRPCSNLHPQKSDKDNPSLDDTRDSSRVPPRLRRWRVSSVAGQFAAGTPAKFRLYYEREGDEEPGRKGSKKGKRRTERGDD